MNERPPLDLYEFLPIDKGRLMAHSQTMSQQVTEKMQAFLPSEDLLFLMQLSIEPIAAQFNSET